MNWMIVIPQNLYIEAPTPNVIIWGGGAFEKELDLDEPLSMGPL